MSEYRDRILMDELYFVLSDSINACALKDDKRQELLDCKHELQQLRRRSDAFHDDLTEKFLAEFELIKVKLEEVSKKPYSEEFYKSLNSPL